MIVVKLTNTDEFTEELVRDTERTSLANSEADKGAVAGGVVRIEWQYKASGASPSVAMIVLAATYVTTTDHIVQLEAFAGDYWRGDTEQTERTEQNARALEQSIRGKAEAAGLEVRAGRFEEGS